MNLDFIPKRITDKLNLCNLDLVYEIRLRKGFPILVRTYKHTLVLLDKGVGSDFNDKNAVVCTEKDIEEIIDNLTERSIYAYVEEIKRGFITSKSGVRIGVAGECVFDGQGIVTVKNISNLNVRIPREIENCALDIFNLFFAKGIRNILIISPPSYGKTTVLKDLIRLVNGRTDVQILVIDERGEFETVKGVNVDTIKFSDKLYAFEYGIRAMSPELIITDELVSQNDWNCVKRASESGVSIIASVHGRSIDDARKKDYFPKGVFQGYVVLKNKNENGRNVYYDGDFNEI